MVRLSSIQQIRIRAFGWSLPFPNYTDFWVKDKEDIATGAKSSKYYLIWAMPETVTATNATANVGRTTEQSRGGIMHVLLYDANRTGLEYNQPNTAAGAVVLPKALIRKPLLTRNFPAGAFRLSSTALSGQTLRFGRLPDEDFIPSLTLWRRKIRPDIMPMMK